jgi:dolichol-phosphate mannosyltransferase
VRFVPVNHRPRGAGKSKYTNFGRLLVSVQDLLGVMWLMKRFHDDVTAKEAE